MRIPLISAARRTRDAARRRWPERRDDSGLATLEWLLIVAAVAGLAALAVVLVRNVVTQTADEIAGSSARLAAATLEAADITEKALAQTIDDAEDLDAMNIRWGRRCEQMNLSYGGTFSTNLPPKEAKWMPGVDTAPFRDYTLPAATDREPLCDIVNP